MAFTTALRSLITSTFATGQAAGAITPARVTTEQNSIADLLDTLATQASAILPSADTSGSTDTAALNAAISATSAGIINLGPGNFYISAGSVTLSSKSGVIIRGAGRYTTILNIVGNGNVVTLNHCNNCGIEAVMFQGNPASPPTSGFALVFTNNCFECWSLNTLYQYVFNAINIHDSTETHIFGKTTMRPIAGPYGILYNGTAAIGCFRAVIEDIIADSYYQSGISSLSQVRGTWSGSTGYSVGDVVIRNSNLYQCVTAGTSSGGPSGISFSNNSNDGSAAWRFVCNISLCWIAMDSYAYSLTIDKAALIDGVQTLAMTDSAGGGLNVSAPQWVECYDLECDHPYLVGINLNAGAGFYLVDGWIGSCLTGNGIVVGSGFSGEVEISTSRIFGNAQHGMLINCPNLYGGISRSLVSTNSTSGAGVYYGIAVAANASNFSVVGNTLGGPNPGYQLYGIALLNGSSDHYNITANQCSGNGTGVYDGGTGSNKNVGSNNS